MRAERELLAHFQKRMDGGLYEKMVERANKAKADMDRDNARLEWSSMRRPKKTNKTTRRKWTGVQKMNERLDRAGHS